MGLLTDPGRSDKIAKILVDYHGKLSLLAFIIGFAWLFALVDENLTLKTYFSENALLPGLVQSEFSSADEAVAAQQYRSLMTVQQNHDDSARPLAEIKKRFQRIGLEVYDHVYNFSSPLLPNKVNGRGVYAILRASRASSMESIVLSVPYRTKSTTKLRTEGGVALLLALAQQFRHKNYWAKDIIFLVTENDFVGLKTWVEAYHGVHSKSSHASSEPLRGRAGSVQAAINLEIPGPDLDYLDISIVGLNGQMPNLDLVNLVRLLVSKQQIPLTIQNNTKLLSRVPGNFIGKFLRDFETISSMVTTAAAGECEGMHGFFMQYNIQSLTIRGLGGSASRRVGFYRLGIALEGICRSLNNLMERFHQSYFFYLMPSPNRFVSIGMYMPPFGLLVVPVVLKALALWARGSLRSASGPNLPTSDIGTVIPWIVLSHCVGLVGFMGHWLLFGDYDATVLKMSTVGSFVVSLFLPFLTSRFLSKNDAELMKSLSLIELAIGLYALSMLNFPLALIITLCSVPVAVWSSSDRGELLQGVQGVALLLMFPVIPMVLYKLVFLTFVKSEPFWLDKQPGDIVMQPVSDAFLQYCEYGNWLYPVLYLFLVPVWTLHWLVFWAQR